MNGKSPKPILAWAFAAISWSVIMMFFSSDFFVLYKKVNTFIGPLAPVFVILLAYALVQAVIILGYAFIPLDDARYETLQEYLDHNRKLAELFPTLGLLGTVLGMIMSSRKLTPEVFFQCLSTTFLGGTAAFVMQLIIIFVDRITFLKMWRIYEPESQTQDSQTKKAQG